MMKPPSRRHHARPSPGPPIAAAALLYLSAMLHPALAQQARLDTPAAGESDFAAAAIAHAQRMRAFEDPDQGAQQTPAAIPQLDIAADPDGRIATYQPDGDTVTATNPFFQDLGSNHRTCFTCHQPQDGWSLAAADARRRFAVGQGSDPLFRLVDGATCPTADVSTLDAKQAAYKLLLEKGLLRIALPMPSPAQFAITSVDDPYHCNTDPVTGLTGPNSGMVSVYRRPLPAANLDFLTAVMWDGREPDLAHQATDATLGHAQADAAPSAAQVKAIVAFESGLFTAQIFDATAHDLRAAGAAGGPQTLEQQVDDFFVGINDPLGNNPKGAAFDPNVFHLYAAWDGVPGAGDETRQRQAIARGEAIFNTTPIDITGVAGLNDTPGMETVHGFCGTCHDTPDVGNHSVKAPLDVGVAERAPPVLDTQGLPVFTLECQSGPLAGQRFVVTDPGRALITGNCADIGKFKGPILRGLAARAPYFHNGSAATLLDVVNFYDQRFKIGLSDQEKSDLVSFLKAL